MTGPAAAGQDDLDAPAPRDASGASDGAAAASDGAAAASRGAPGGAGDGAGPALAPVDRRIFVVAAVVFAVLMAFSARYGFDRDKL